MRKIITVRLLLLLLLLVVVIDVSFGGRQVIYRRSEFAKLHDAIRSYNELLAYTLIEYDFHRNVDVQNATGWAPLHVAAQAGSEAFAAYLIDSDADLRIQTKNGYQPLHIAVINNRLSFAQLLLRTDPSLATGRCCGNSSRTISHLAAEWHITEMLYLIPQYFNATVLDGYGQPPICWAARNGSVQFGQKLLEDPKFIRKDVQINDPICVYENGSNKVKAPLLHIASYYQQPQFVEMLITKGVNVSSRDTSGGTALHALARNRNANLTKAVAIAGDLVRVGVDIETRDWAGRTPYLVAILLSSTRIAQLLDQRLHANVYVVDLLGYSAFHLAPQIEVIDYLSNVTSPSRFIREINRKSLPSCTSLSKEACPDSLRGLTPLLLAIRIKRDLKFIKYLVENVGSDVQNAVNDLGQNVFHLAVEANYVKALKYFLSGPYKNMTRLCDNFGRTPLFYAIETNSTDAAHIILTSLEFRSEVLNRQALKVKSYTPLHMAVQNENNAMVEFLISYGANMTLLASTGRNPLHEAIASHDLKMAKKLIDLSTPDDIAAPDRLGRTSLHLSVANFMADYEIAKLILARCPTIINSIDEFGDSPLHRAVYHESLDTARLFLENNASCYVQDANDRTPLRLAKQIANEDLVQLIRQFCNDSYLDEECSNINGGCNDDGSSGVTSLVVKTCSSVPFVAHGEVESGTSYVGSVRKFRCYPGYIAEGLSTVNCTDSHWVVDGYCRKACRGGFEIPSGVIDIAEGDDDYGVIGWIRCLAGHKIFGHNVAFCNAFGHWELSGRCQVAVSEYFKPDYFTNWSATPPIETLLAGGSDIEAIVTLQNENYPYEKPSVLVITHSGLITALSRSDWKVAEWQARVFIEGVYILHAVYDSKEDDIYFTNYGAKFGEQIYRASRWSLMTANSEYASIVPLQVLIHRSQTEGRRFRGLAIDSDARLLYACDFDGDVNDISVWYLLPSISSETGSLISRQAQLVGSIKMKYPPMFCSFFITPRQQTPAILGGTKRRGAMNNNVDKTNNDTLLLAVSNHYGNTVELHAASYKMFVQAVRREIKQKPAINNDDLAMMMTSSAESKPNQNQQDELGNLFHERVVIADFDRVNKSRLGAVYCPFEVVFDSVGNLFVADNCNFRVQIFKIDNSEDNYWMPMRALWALNSTKSNIHHLKITKHPQTGKPVVLMNLYGSRLSSFGG